MRRLYLVAPNLESAKRTIDELLLARIDDRHIHVVGTEGVELEDLPEASFLQKTDFAHAIEQGLALGGATGALAGLVAISIPTGLVLAGGAVLLATTLAGAGVGAWAASLRALNIPNTHLQQFEEDLKQGKILIMVDVPKDRLAEIRERIQRTNSDIKDKGEEPRIAFP